MKDFDFHMRILKHQPCLAFLNIFLHSSLLIIYLFICCSRLYIYQFSRTKTNNSISVEDHSYVRKEYNFMIWYSMQLFFCAFGPHLTWSLFASTLYVELILLSLLLLDLPSGSFLRILCITQFISLLYFLYPSVVLYIEVTGNFF